MANQMIALQARNPQLPDPARATAQMANMMNMASQQRAAQLQGERIRQEMDFARAGEDRAIQTQQASMREKDLSFMVNDMKRLRNIGVAVLGSRSEEGYQSWVDMVEATDPQLGATIRQVAPTFNPDIMNYLITEADKYIDKNIPQRTSKSEFDANGNLIIIDQGGFDPAKIRAGVITDQPDMARPQSVPPATPTAAAGTPMRATRGANTTPQDLMDQGMDPRNIPSGMPTSPASFTRGGMAGAGAGQMTPEVAQQIVDAAVKTGMMAQADFDQLMALAPEQNKQPFMDMIRANNITLQPDGMGQRPQSQFADLRGPAPQSQTAGLRGAAPMEQTLAQYQVGQQVKGRNPNLSPYPGSAQVPIERVRQEAAAGRETANEVYAKELARARAARDAAKEAGPKPLTPVQEAKLRDNIAKDYKSARSTISMMLDPVSGVVASVNKVRKLSPAQKEAITGYSGYLPSITPGSRSADTAIKNLRGKVTEMGKSAAALTGAIGQMAVQEWRIVSDMIASLDIEGMEPADLDNQLDIIEAQARRAAEVTRDAYENQYVEEFARYPGRFQLPSSAGTPVNSRPKAEAQLPRVRGNADYNKLKPGTEFIDPNGVRRRKPK